MVTKDLEEQFWKHVDKNGPVPAHAPHLGPCHLWTGDRSGDRDFHGGYGELRYGPRKARKRVLAHRLAFEIHTGHPPKNRVLHRCDNPPCVNGNHLFDGTHADNTADMIAKSRKPPHPNKGKATPRTKSRSGPTKSYQARVDAGLTPVFIWLPPDAAKALEALCERSRLNKRDVLVELLLATTIPGYTPFGKPEPEAKPRRTLRDQRETHERARGAVAAPSGSPQDIAERVRANGARRRASVL